MHYTRWKLHGDVGEAAPRQAPWGSRRTAVCAVVGCEAQVKAKGLCVVHYSRQRATGDVGEAARRHRPRGERTKAERDAAQRLRKFGVTLERFNEMLAAQGGLCAICRRNEPYSDGRRWCIDHDHRCCPGDRSCGKCVRGLLCSQCNHAIGLLQDDPEIVRTAASYLESYR